MNLIDGKIVNIDGLRLEHFSKGEEYECNAVRIGPLLGARDLGYSYGVVPPGKRSCPFHCHRGEEEMFFIVRGTGRLRFGSESRDGGSFDRPLCGLVSRSLLDGECCPRSLIPAMRVFTKRVRLFRRVDVGRLRVRSPLS